MKRILSFLIVFVMVFSLCVVATGSVNAESDAVKVYFENVEGWSEVYAYLWNDASYESFGEWPGIPCDYEGDGIYSIVMPADSQYIIFNNNSNNNRQTEKLDKPHTPMMASLREYWDPSEFSFLHRYVWVECEETEKSTVDEATQDQTTVDEATKDEVVSVDLAKLENAYIRYDAFPQGAGYNTVVYYDNVGWDRVYIYAYRNGSGECMSSFPGELMRYAFTDDMGNNMYISFVPEKYDMCIIHNGEGIVGDLGLDAYMQSIDIKLEKSIGLIGEIVSGRYQAFPWVMGPDFYNVESDATEDEIVIDIDTLPEKAEGTFRYFFYAPSDWVEHNPYTESAGIYWWEGSDSPSGWPGYAAKPTGCEGIYYFDVAENVPTIIWNNFVDGTQNSASEIFSYAFQTVDISTSGYSKGESVIYSTLENFDNMIYVIDYDRISVNSYSGKETYGGEWFYYYGNGIFGNTAVKAEADYVFVNSSVDLTRLENELAENLPQATEPSTASDTEATTVVHETEPTEIPDATDPTEAPSEPVETEPTETAVSTEPSVTSTAPAEGSSATTPTTEPEPEYEIGDANKDGKINIKDATVIQKHIAKMLTLDQSALILADFDLNGKVNVRDATAIQKKIAGLI